MTPAGGWLAGWWLAHHFFRHEKLSPGLTLSLRPRLLPPRSCAGLIKIVLPCPA